MRCNCGIDPKNLTDEHLFAESRELKMLPSLFKRVGNKSINKVPAEFTLGRGHMLFFLYKWMYTYTRYCNCIEELKKRGYNIKDERRRWDIYKGTYREAFFGTGKEADIVKQRISEKIKRSPKEYFHYNHKRISKEEAIELLSKENIYSVVENLLGYDYITVPIEHIDKNGGHGNTLSVKIVLPTWCQANCEFCFNKVNKDLQVHNLEEFKKNLDKGLRIIQNSMTNRKITLDITGNEPTFNPVFLKEVLDIISKYKTDIVDKIVITTNGYHLLDFENLYPIDIVNISLHHYDFQKRKDIFRTSLIPNDDELKILCQRFNTTAIAVCDETDIDFEKFTYNFAEYAKNIGFKNIRIRTNYLTNGTIFYNSFKDVHIDSHAGLDKKILDINGYNVNLYRGIKELTSCVIGPEIVIDDNGLIYLDYYKKYQLSGDDVRVFNNCIFVKK